MNGDESEKSNLADKPLLTNGLSGPQAPALRAPAPNAPAIFGRAEQAGFSADLIDLIIRHFCRDRSACLKALMEQVERNIIARVLDETHWNQRKTAQILGVKHTTLNHKVFKLGLHGSREDRPRRNLKDILAGDFREGQKEHPFRD
jgi:hypothetical protein